MKIVITLVEIIIFETEKLGVNIGTLFLQTKK